MKMYQSKLFKTIAFVNFIGLLSLFLLYRNGSFDKYLYNETNTIITSPNGGTPVKTNKDASTSNTDSLNNLRLSSSKSAIIFDPIKRNKDSIAFKKDSINKILINEKMLMYGSKSGIIIDPKKIHIDSLSSKRKTKKNKKQK